MSVPGIKEIRPYLTFTLDDKLFALDVASVREVLEYSAISQLPPKNGFVQGIISLRGLKVAVINLKKKLEMKTAGYVLDACVLVLETKPAAGEKSIGILADSLQEVLELEPDRIEPASGPEFVKGIGKKDEKYFSIIDIDRILAPEEYETLDETEDETGR